ncbi:hypothetical protein GNX71_28650 [Variovorax sp. RKNM96]|uniref:hypothetical protein n=1 Tax=Variovorax sp. RKNM96 TaxID=2681552 RepID=UPI00197FB045|nr:hypothetical protein [Variovorax sp. RKNM96]QSI33320.1 hypothetical protein GNX71_28650 [Variovorax sp. RKNM96]
MNTIPSTLSPEATAWLHTQIAIQTARAVAPLREEMDRLDDWANGLFVVFTNVLPFMLREQPKLAEQLAPQWLSAAERFDALQATGDKRTKDGETLELLEARKMLYRVFEVLKLWPVAQSKRAARHVARGGRPA